MSTACTQGNARRAAVSIATAELAKVARLAVGDSRRARHAASLIPQRKTEATEARSALTEHVAACERCQNAEVTA